jgi:hypothetical protein
MDSQMRNRASGLALRARRDGDIFWNDGNYTPGFGNP